MVTPYYQSDGVTLFHGNALEITGWTEAAVLVFDPPYGINYRSNMNRDRRNTKIGRPVQGDADTTVRDQILALWGTRPALVFGRWDVPRPATTRMRLVWDKGGGFLGDLKLPWGCSDEEVYVLGRGFVGARSGSVLRCQMLMSGNRERPDHPTPKPVPLMELLLTKCPPGVIADPCAGSGPTLLAAKRLGLPAIGVEIEERHCELIARRLDQGALSFDEAS